jgi:hypothetical protein
MVVGGSNLQFEEEGSINPNHNTPKIIKLVVTLLITDEFPNYY